MGLILKNGLGDVIPNYACDRFLVPQPDPKDLAFSPPENEDEAVYLRNCHEALDGETEDECRARLAIKVGWQKSYYRKIIY